MALARTFQLVLRRLRQLLDFGVWFIIAASLLTFAKVMLDGR